MWAQMNAQSPDPALATVLDMFGCDDDSVDVQWQDQAQHQGLYLLLQLMLPSERQSSFPAQQRGCPSSSVSSCWAQ